MKRDDDDVAKPFSGTEVTRLAAHESDARGNEFLNEILIKFLNKPVKDFLYETVNDFHNEPVNDFLNVLLNAILTPSRRHPDAI